MPAVVLHHLERSRSTRVLWLLGELDIAFEMKTYQRDANLRADPALRELHPLGKAPILCIDDAVLAESGAIIEEVVDSLGGGRLRPPDDTPERRLYRYWLHYAEGSLMTPLLVKLITTQLRKAKVPFLLKPVVKGVAGKIDGMFTDNEISRHMAFIEQHLGTHPFFAGDAFSAADIQMIYGVEAGETRGGLDTPLPNVKAWLERMHARPAYIKALEQGGPLF